VFQASSPSPEVTERIGRVPLDSFAFSLSAFRTHPPVSVSSTVFFARCFLVFSDVVKSIIDSNFRSFPSSDFRFSVVPPRLPRGAFPLPSGIPSFRLVKKRLLRLVLSSEPPHLVPPFSFPLGTVDHPEPFPLGGLSPFSHFSTNRNLWVYGRMDSQPSFSLLMSTFSLLIA
jgi:hypothetical protein